MGAAVPGCWTCRLRHKKCDLNKPFCKECCDRKVHCHGYGPKPTWFDGGLEENKERSRIKAAVKKNFRLVRKMQNQARRMDKDHSQVSSPTSIRDQETEKDAATSSLRSSIGPLSMYDAETCKLSTEDAERDLSPFKTVETEADHPRSRGENPISNDMMFDSQEAWLFMHYLDEVFPWQFPYHSSYSQIGNRGWLLLLMAKRGPLYHAAISLSSLHQTAISEDECEQKEEALIKHSRALRELCGFMSLQKPLENKACLTEFLASCLILISCEVFRGAEHDWLLHLDVVSSLICNLSPDQVFESNSCLYSKNTNHTSGTSEGANTQSHESLTFLITAFIWFDLFSCLSTRRAPQLPYKNWLHIPGLNTADLMGCENWAMEIIGDLASLLSWKDGQEKNGLLSTRDLARRGREIESRLKSGIQSLDLVQIGKLPFESQTGWVTLLFALAAQVQLNTVIYGPIPALPEIQHAVSKTIETLRERPKAYSLRGTVWALCVTGCMAQPPNQPFFENLMAGLIDISAGFGNSKTILKIMRTCWEMQKTGTVDCRITMSKMGICALLI